MTNNQPDTTHEKIGIIEIKSRAIDKNASLLKNEAKELALKIDSAFKINLASVEDEINDIERRAGLIKIGICAIKNEIKPISEIIIPNEWKSKALKKRIAIIEKAIKRSVANVLVVDGKTKAIEKKVATASPHSPFIKHHQFSVTR